MTEFLREWLRKQIIKRPGATTQYLFTNRPGSSGGAAAFDAALEELRASGEFRVANQQWWQTGCAGTLKPPRQGKPAHPRQLDLFAAPAGKR